MPQPPLITFASATSIALAFLAQPAVSEPNFAETLQELRRQQQDVMMQAAADAFDTSEESLTLGVEFAIGPEAAEKTMILYTSVNCEYCKSLMSQIGEKVSEDRLNAANVLFVNRHAGDLFDGVMLSCFIGGRSALYAALFQIVANRVSPVWTEAEAEQILFLSGQGVGLNECLSVNALEKAYSDFIDLLSLCDMSGCPTIDRLSEENPRPAKLTATPVLYVGHREPGSNIVSVTEVVQGLDIGGYLDFLTR